MKRENLVKGMVFQNENEGETLVLIKCDSRNIWEVGIDTGKSDEYLRHDYIFTDERHGYSFVGFMIDNTIRFFQ